MAAALANGARSRNHRDAKRGDISDPRGPRTPRAGRWARILNTKTRVIVAVVAVLVLEIAVISVIARAIVGERSTADVVVKVRTTAKFGRILVTTRGVTLYIYELDTRNHSNCVGFCLHEWPPLVVPSGVKPGGLGVSGLGAINRPGGIRQVTYEGMPLYLYVFDDYPGQITGVGNSWNVVHLK